MNLELVAVAAVEVCLIPLVRLGSGVVLLGGVAML